MRERLKGCMIENNVSNMARIDVKGDVDDQRAKSRPHVLVVWDLPLPRLGPHTLICRPSTLGIFIR
jgi:hypothetical protein